MKLNEAAGLMGLSREQTLTTINDGVTTPTTGDNLRLVATPMGDDYDITEDDLETFIARFELEEPGRHPPAAVRRQLLVEAHHRCGICRDSAPLQFHHMVDWAKLKHHDPRRMLAVCGTCHDRCGRGDIDYKSQLEYKSQLLRLDRRKAEEVPFDAAKRTADVKMIREIFSEMHTGTINAFFTDGNRDVVGQRVFIFWEGFHAIMQESTLFLYDKTLLSLFIEFHQLWEKSLSYGAWFRPLFGSSGFKFSFDFGNGIEIQKQHADFHRDLADTEAAFRLLYEYIRCEFPEFDPSETDAIAWKSNLQYF